MNRIDYSFKFIIVGDSVVGKSSLMKKYIHDKYEDRLINTIGIDFSIRVIERTDKKVKLLIWDTAGQERFKNIISSYYRDVDAILICYDITNKKSFENLNYWIQKVDNLCNEYAEVIIIGTKLDLEEQIIIKYDDANKISKDYGYNYIEISAKDNDSNKLGEVIFNPLIDRLIETKDKYKERNKEIDKNFLVLKKSKIIKDNNCCLN